MQKRPFISGAILGLLLTVAIPLTTLAVEEANFDLETTADLYALCSVKADNPDYLPSHWACKGFIEGAVQYHDGVSDQTHLKRLICYPETATISDGKASFVAWGTENLDNTEYMNEIPVIGLVRALSAKYPCSE
jgi:hypothetical protein